MARLGWSFDPSSVALPCGGIATAFALAQAGISVFPADETIGLSGPSKRPTLVRSWQQESTVDLDRISRWWKSRPGALVAIDLAKAGLVVIDPDRHGDRDGVAAFESLIAQHGLPEGVPISVTQSGGRHYIFAQPSGKRLGNKEGRLGALGINVRGAGGYIIAPGSIAPGGLCWSLQDGSPDLCETYEEGIIPPLPQWLCDLIDAPKSSVATEPPLVRQSEPGRRETGATGARERAYALSAVENECRELSREAAGGRNNALNRAAFNMGTLIGAGWLSRSEAEGALYGAAQDCGLVKDKGPIAAKATIKSGLNAGLSHPRRELEPAPEATILHMPKARATITVADVTADAETGEVLESPQTARAAQTPLIVATPYEWPEGGEIAPRQWLYGRHLIRGFVSATVAPGGVGKSSLVITEALAMVSGRPLLHGIAPTSALNVWLWNGEDPLEELNRRISASCLQHKIRWQDCKGKLFVDSGRDTRIIVAEMDRHGVRIATPIVQAIRQQVEEHGIDVIVIDPFVSSHRVSENDNNAIDAVAREWANIAHHTGCAIELVHHSRKTGGDEVSIHDARGASALISAARSARVLNPMQDDMAASFDLENARRFFRVTDGKSSMSPPGEYDLWYEMKSIALGNGPDGGDHVGVVAEWKKPSHHSNISTDDLREIQARLAVPTWRDDVRSAHWAGKVVAEVLDFDIYDSQAKDRIKRLLFDWINDGYLQVIESRDDQRKIRRFVVKGTDIDFHSPR